MQDVALRKLRTSRKTLGPVQVQVEDDDQAGQPLENVSELSHCLVPDLEPSHNAAVSYSCITHGSL